MRMRSLIGVVVLTVLLGIWATTPVEGQNRAAAHWEIPDISYEKSCCLAQFYQTTKVGDMAFTLAKSHDCKFLVPKPQNTAQASDAVIHLPRLEPGNCDQTNALFQKSPLDLRAKGQLIYRQDSLAHFAGDFSLTSPAGISYKGRMEAIFRIGTHTSPIGTEPCDPRNHVEGWLVGSGPKYTTLRAQFAIRFQGDVPSEGQAKLKVTGAVLNGVVTQCP